MGSVTGRNNSAAHGHGHCWRKALGNSQQRGERAQEERGQEIILKLETCSSGFGFVLVPLLLAWAGNQLPTQKLSMMRNKS